MCPVWLVRVPWEELKGWEAVHSRCLQHRDVTFDLTSRQKVLEESLPCPVGLLIGKQNYLSMVIFLSNFLSRCIFRSVWLFISGIIYVDKEAFVQEPNHSF